MNLQSVAVSACGNFGYVGCSSGQLDQYNLQSGLHRLSFNHSSSRHFKPITSIACDATNRILVSASIDGTVKLWCLRSGNCLHSTDFGTSISQILLHAESNLLAVVGDDFGVRILDIDTHNIVRELWGHDNRITDVVRALLVS